MEHRLVAARAEHRVERCIVERAFRREDATCGRSNSATSNGGLPPLAAVSRDSWSLPSRIDCVTEAPVFLVKAGARYCRCASFQVPGKVAATSCFPCAKAEGGRTAAAPSAAPA